MKKASGVLWGRGKLIVTIACLLGISAGVQAQTLTEKWSNLDLATGHRCIAYNPVTKNILVAKTDGNLLRFNSADGLSAGANLDNTDISGGTFALSGVAVQKDGTIFACNYVRTNAVDLPLKIYKWDNEDAIPTVVASLPTVAGTSSDRFGAAIKVFNTATTTNILISGNTTIGYLAIYSGDTWTFKQLTCDSQVFTPGGTFIDYNAPGFANKFRVVAKSRGSSGQLYNFDPTTAGTINLTAAGNKTPMTGEWSFKANGITSHAYDPVTGLLGGVTSTLQTAGAVNPYTNMIFNTTGGPSAPVELSRVTIENVTNDGGQAGGTAWGEGRLFTLIPIGGAGLRAFDISVFLITGPADATRVAGQSVSFSSVFGGSGLTYTWTKDGGSPLVDDSKYSGTTNAVLTINNLVSEDAGVYTVTATDANSGTAMASATLTMSPSKAWTGGGTDDFWTTADNWGGIALDASGETAVFAGTTRLTPVMDGSYDLLGLVFADSAGTFTLTNSSGSLTLSGSLVSDSPNVQTIALPLTLNSDQAVDLTGPVDISGTISGAGALTKTGSGVLTLSGSNDHTGAINVSEGMLAVKNGNAILDATTVTLATGGTLSVDSAETIGGLAGSASSVVLNEKLTIGGLGATYTGGVTGTSDLEIAAIGTQVINSAMTHSGNTILTAGTLSINDGSMLGTGTLEFSGGTLFRATQSTAQTFANPVVVTADSFLAGNPVTGTRMVLFSTTSLTSTGGMLTITNTAVSGNGVLQVRLTANSPTCSMPIHLAQGEFGFVQFMLTNNANGNQVVSGPISGNGRVLKHATAATGRQATLSGNNSFSGGLEIRGGRMNLNHNNAAGTGTITITNADLASTVSGTVITNPITLQASASVNLYAGTSSGLELAGTISDEDGGARLTRNNGGSGTVTLSGDNTFGGGVLVSSRTLALKHKNALGSGTLTIGDPNQTLASTAVTISAGANLTGPDAIANSVIVNTNFTVSAGTGNAIEFLSDLSLGISGKGLTKTGAGTLVLSGGNNSYDGTTTVSAGTLRVAGGLNSSPVTVGVNGTLIGGGYIYQPITVNGTISGGNTVGTLNSVDQTWNGGGRYKWEINDAIGSAGADPGWDSLYINGALTINATPSSKFSINVTSLAESVPGDAANFDGTMSAQTWTIVTTTGGITGFDPAAFTVTMNAFSNVTSGATFAVRTANSGNDLELYLIYPPQNVTSTGEGTGTFTGKADTQYTVYYTDDLAQNWQVLGFVTTDGGGIGSFVDPGPLPSHRFYRIALP